MEEEDLYDYEGYGDPTGVAVAEPPVQQSAPTLMQDYWASLDPNSPSNPKNQVKQNYQQQTPSFNVADFGPDVDWDYVNKAVSTIQRAQALQRQQQAAHAKAEQDAVRFQGVQEYGELVKGGATPQEALRRTAGKINYQNPAAIFQTTRMLTTTPELPTPTVEEIGGVKVINFGNRRQIIPGQSIAPKSPPRPPPLTQSQKDENFTARAEYKAALSEYNKVKQGEKDSKGKLVVDPDLLTKAARRLRIAENFLNPKTEPSKTTPTTSVEPSAPSFKEGSLIRSKKNGKLYKVVNGQPELVEE